MYRLNNDKLAGKQWDALEFEISDGAIKYFTERPFNSQSVEEASFPLLGCSVAVISPGECAEPLNTFPFHVRGPGPTIDPSWDLVLSAYDEPDRTEWINTIQKCSV